MFVQRKTINTSVSISGIGLHSGLYTTVELRPVRAGSGVTFVRADLDGLRIPALQAFTTALDYATTLDIPFVFSSNGDGFVFHDRTGASDPREANLGLDAFQQ